MCHIDAVIYVEVKLKKSETEEKVVLLNCAVSILIVFVCALLPFLIFVGLFRPDSSAVIDPGFVYGSKMCLLLDCYGLAMYLILVVLGCLILHQNPRNFRIVGYKKLYTFYAGHYMGEWNKLK